MLSGKISCTTKQINKNYYGDDLVVDDDDNDSGDGGGGDSDDDDGEFIRRKIHLRLFQGQRDHC